jgi:hypothetical protein
MDTVDQIRMKYEVLASAMDERTTRLWAASEALALGHGGTLAVTQATGILRKRILAGKRDIEAIRAGGEASADGQRVRRPGAGRKRLVDVDGGLQDALQALIDPVTRGDPMSALRWTSKGVRTLADALTKGGRPVSPSTVGRLLADLGFSLQANRKSREGKQHPDRDAQFRYINKQVKAFHARTQPVISVDTKKKELVGDFKNGGREWQRKGEPEKVRTHDFIDKELGKAIPYGVYDVYRNEGWVNVGINYDTSEFAVESIRRWWHMMGRAVYPSATDLLITADSGGSNGSRVRLWKLALQRFATETGLNLHICHYPPGTSKWNKIEHRMFSHITANWRGRPLTSLETIVNLIGNTTTTTGLRIQAGLDQNYYPRGKKVTVTEVATILLRSKRTRPKWNYVIRPAK